MFVCGVHPKRGLAKGTDPRVSLTGAEYCNTRFLCAAAREYTELTLAEKKKYLAFIQELVESGMDSYEYSMRNNNDELWDAYQKEKLQNTRAG